eukprot:7352504-Karenia_brevis.AAC.1
MDPHIEGNQNGSQRSPAAPEMDSYIAIDREGSRRIPESPERNMCIEEIKTASDGSRNQV